MDTSNPSIAMQQHLATMPSSDAPIMSTALVSDRLGVENMDGQGILAGQIKSYARPWMGCIPSDQLTKDNLPPFYVRLQDDQVGHLAHWVSTSRGSISRPKLHQFWPWDFGMQGNISSRRDSWGAAFSEFGTERGKGLRGGKKIPTWTDPGLPLTYTSSHKVMAKELDALKKGATLKRKAEEEAGRNVCMPVKKPRLNNVGTELKKMKEAAEQKLQKDKATEKGRGRHTGAKSELRDAVQIVDTLMKNATETETQNATLKAMLIKNEAQYIKDTDDMFDGWLAYNEIKRLEVDRIYEDHALEIKSRDTKIETLESEMNRSKAHLESEKQKARVRDKRLGRAKRLWEQERAFMERKFREIEEKAVDLDELPEFYYDTDELDDEESDSEAEPEEAEEEAKKEGKAEAKADAREEQKEESREAKQAKEAKEAKEANRVKEAKETKDAKEPKLLDATSATKSNAKASLDQSPQNSIIPKTTHSTDTKAPNNLNGVQDDEDEAPISSQRKRKLRNKPAQTV